MRNLRWLSAVAFSLIAASSASAQVVRCEMTVTGAEMH
jgi:hypothetical protein